MKRALCVSLLAALAASTAFAGQDGPPEGAERYRIQASDVLVVKYRYSPEYDYSLMVQPDGFISLPIIGEVKVGGLTLAEAIAATAKQASLRLRDPEVTIEVKEFQRPRFFVTGEVGAPGEFPLRGRLGLLEAIAMAGGFKSSAKHSQVVHFRQVDKAHAIRTVLNAKELAKNAEERDIVLQPGDLLFVPQNRISKVTTVMVPITGMATVGLFLNSIVD
jgi:polysaccharide export outer membrane protein